MCGTVVTYSYSFIFLDLKAVVLGLFMVDKPLFEDLFFLFVKLVVFYQKSAHLDVGARQYIYSCCLLSFLSFNSSITCVSSVCEIGCFHPLKKQK